MDLTLRTDTFGMDDQSWLGSRHGTNNAVPVTLDTSAFTEATHYPDGYFPSGLPLGRITADDTVGPYDGAALDGRESLAGFLLSPIKAPADGTSDVVGAMLDHGKVVADRLPIAVDAAGQADAAGRIIFL